MPNRGKNVQKSWNFHKWLDDFVLASKGIVLATKEKRFWYGFAPAFIFFGMLISLLSGGLGKFELMGMAGFSGTMKILGDAFLSVFGVNRIFLEWLPNFLLALLQGVLIGLIVLLWQKKKAQASLKAKDIDGSRAKSGANEANQSNVDGVEKAGIVTGLIALGAGCPTCGTTLLTPLFGAMFSTGSLTAVGVASTVVTILAVIIAIFSLKRLGLEAYVMIINEKYLAKKAKRSEKMAENVEKVGKNAEKLVENAEKASKKMEKIGTNTGKISKNTEKLAKNIAKSQEKLAENAKKSQEKLAKNVKNSSRKSKKKEEKNAKSR